MIGSKRDAKAILKAGARARGISLSEYREQFQQNIYAMKESHDPEVQAEFKKCFGNKIPTPEEYIYITAKYILKKSKIKF